MGVTPATLSLNPVAPVRIRHRCERRPAVRRLCCYVGARPSRVSDRAARRLAGTLASGSQFRPCVAEAGVCAPEPGVTVSAVLGGDAGAHRGDGALPDGDRPPRPRSDRRARRQVRRGDRRGAIRAQQRASRPGGGRRHGDRRLAREGLGTLLLDAISARARAEGIRTFSALVLATNDEMLDLLSVWTTCGSSTERRARSRSRSRSRTSASRRR